VAAVLSNGRLGEHVTLRDRPCLTSSSSSITAWKIDGRHGDERIYKRNSRPVHTGKSSPRACDHHYFVWTAEGQQGLWRRMEGQLYEKYWDRRAEIGAQRSSLKSWPIVLTNWGESHSSARTEIF